MQNFSRSLFGQTEPTEGCPIVEPLGDILCALFYGSGAAAESDGDGALQRFASAQGGENCELFAFDTAEINPAVDAMNHQKNIRGLQAGYGGHAFTAFFF